MSTKDGSPQSKRAKTDATCAEAVAYAKELRAILSMKEGPEVETKMYEFATHAVKDHKPLRNCTWNQVLSAFHAENVNDQFIPPIVRVQGSPAQPVGTIRPGDAIIYFDFRTDRAKPLTAAFLDTPFGGQVGGLSPSAAAARPDDVLFVSMTNYDSSFTKHKFLRIAFDPAEPLKDTYAEVVGRAGVDQLVVAESEKWRAVTWFKDGRRNLGYTRDARLSTDELTVERHPSLPIEVRIVPSRRVSAHIEAPQMRAAELTDVLLDGVKRGVTDIFANYANADMVAHAMTAAHDMPGVVRAVRELDAQLGRLVPAALAANYVVIITGDHGNAESMELDGKPNPAHTTNKVPLIVLGLTAAERAALALADDVTIGDMAPLCMALRGAAVPAGWDRRSPLRAAAGGGPAKPLPAAPRRRLMRLILDGYGVRDDASHNAMAAAAADKGAPLLMDEWLAGTRDNALAARAEASGLECGYPEGQAGTTEFGHVLFDAGRTVRSDLTLIDYAIESGAFAKNAGLLDAFERVRADPSRKLHIMGILSDGKVHSSLVHLEAILKASQEAGVSPDQLSLHPITDGRDVAGDSSPDYVTWLEAALRKYGRDGRVGRINSVAGRGWGKDRDNRWQRIEAHFRALVEGTAAIHLAI